MCVFSCSLLSRARAKECSFVWLFFYFGRRKKNNGFPALCWLRLMRFWNFGVRRALEKNIAFERESHYNTAAGYMSRARAASFSLFCVQKYWFCNFDRTWRHVTTKCLSRQRRRKAWKDLERALYTYSATASTLKFARKHLRERERTIL